MNTDMLTLAYQCPHCESGLIVHQSTAQWRVDTQQFDFVKVSSKAQCLHCGATFQFLAPVEFTEEFVASYHRVMGEYLAK